MIALENVESLRAYGDRLHRERAQFVSAQPARRGTVREFVRRVRRSA
jgi:hypothetical protein